jgi:hypothetical protein
MKLIPDSIASTIPNLYSQEKKGENAIVYVKLFCPRNGWLWYITEYDKENNEAFGLVVGYETELGYISITELEETNFVFRDRHFTPRTLRECRREE